MIWRAGVGTAALLLVGVIAARGLPLPVALALFCLACAIAIWTPLGLSGAVVIAVPWVYRPIQIGDLQVSHLEVAILTGVVAMVPRLVLVAVGEGRSTIVNRLVRPVRVTLPLAALLIVASLSLTYVAEPSHLRESLREYRTVIVEPLLAFLVFRWTLGNSASRLYVVACLLLSGAAVAVLAMSSQDAVLADGVERLTGPYPHPNNLALYLERGTLLGAGVLVVARRSWPWWSFTALVALCALGTVLTSSRGALLALLAGGLYIAIRAGRRTWTVPLVALGAISAAALAISRGRLTATGSTGTEFTRLPIWRGSLEMIRDYPLTGVGLDQFLYQYWPRYVEPVGWPERYTSHPHNLLLDLWLRLGILGPALGMWLIAVVWSLRGQVSGGEAVPTWSDALRIAGVAALLGGLVHGLVDNGFFLPDLAVLTWLCVALVEPAPDPVP